MSDQDKPNGGVFGFAIFLTILVVGGWSLFWAGQALAGSGISYNPLDLLRVGMDPERSVAISVGGVIASAVIFLALLAAVFVIAGVKTKRKATRKGANVMDSTRHMATGHHIARMSRKQVTKKTAETNPDLPDDALPGQLLGKELRTGKEVWLDYETLTVDLWAARYGKTTGRVLPMLLGAPGGAIATGNKPDVVNDSLAARQSVGHCYVCDPQRVWMGPDEAPDFYVDLLDYIRRRPQDEWDQAAADLAVLFANNAGIDIGQGGQGEEWRTSGAQLLSALLLAATVSGRQVTDIIEWVYDQSNREPLEILKQYGFPAMAVAAKGSYDQTEKTRAGIFFSIQYMTNALTMKTFQRWVTPQPGVPKFDPADFIAEHEAGRCPTLYLLSKNGNAGAGGLLVLTLVAWMTEAGEYAARRRGGRLRIPLFFPLDEAANIVKWGKLAEVYSYFGSMGMILSSIFQSFRQPKRIFGADNASDMRTNATLIVGGGIKDKESLEEIVALVGEYQRRQVSHSTSTGNYQTQTQIGENDKMIVTVAQLRGLDAGLMLVIPQKNEPMIVEAVPYWERELREEMRAAAGELDKAKQRARILADEEVSEGVVA